MIAKILWNSHLVSYRAHFNFRTEMGVYQKKSFFKVQNKTNRLFKLFHFTMVSFRFASESTFFSMRHMIQPNMSCYVYKIFKSTVNYTLNKATYKIIVNLNVKRLMQWQAKILLLKLSKILNFRMQLENGIRVNYSKILIYIHISKRVTNVDWRKQQWVI